MGKISAFYVIAVLRNDKKCEYIFVLYENLKNSTVWIKGLSMKQGQYCKALMLTVWTSIWTNGRVVAAFIRCVSQ